MKPEDFVSRLRSAVVEENMALYRQLFTTTSIEKTTDQYWRRVLPLFNDLKSAQQEVLFEIVRQVIVDTVSNTLGVIDGVNALEGFAGEFELRYEGEAKLNGDLQSLFLVEEERGLQTGLWR